MERQRDRGTERQRDRGTERQRDREGQRDSEVDGARETGGDREDERAGTRAPGSVPRGGRGQQALLTLDPCMRRYSVALKWVSKIGKLKCVTKSVSFSCQDPPLNSPKASAFRQLSVSFSCYPFSLTRLETTET